MKMKRFLACVLALCMILTLCPTAPARAVETEGLEIEKLDGSAVNLELKKDPNVDEALKVESGLKDTDLVKVIIRMEGQGVAEENPSAVLSTETRVLMGRLEEKQNQIVASIEKQVLGSKMEVDYNYTWLLNGVAATIPYGAIAAIRKVEGVESVMLQKVYSVCTTTNTPATPNTITDGVMIGRESAWANGYTGQGMKIAIIDTGLDTDHQNFAPLAEDKLTDTSADSSTVAAVLGDLNASVRYEGLTLEDVYYNTKVVYGFNYCDDDLDITHADGAGDHGTHVAGIAAANKVESSEVVGVAPDAQLYIMKVFGKNGGAYTMDILAALEDALMLGADVVNMSLGSPAGFNSGDYTELGDPLDPVYESVAATGTVLSVSAGNNYNSGYANAWGTDRNLTAYPDNGVVGAPGAYVNTMTVASVENWQIQRNYISAGDHKMSYYDSESFGLPALTTLTGSYGLVAVPGNGEPADYEGLELEGKIALVQRGVTSFMEKHSAAEAAGAVAILVYNNTTGEFGMDMTGSACTTPAAAISMADGAWLLAALVENPELTVSFPTGVTGFPSELAYEMSDFSSMGPTPNLTLAPDITAPGGNIYSTVDNGQYGLMSGTSMAAPNIAGMSALVMQYVKENFPAGTDYRAMTQALLMSTSAPLVYDQETGLAYSPRSQGSGLANVFNAITTNAYLSVPGADNAKADLGDDAGRTGAFGFTFQVHNFGTNPAYYALDTAAQSEGVLELGGLYFMSGTPVALGAASAESSSAMVAAHDVNNDGKTDSYDAYLIYNAAKGGNDSWKDEAFRYEVDAAEGLAESDVQAYLDALVGKTSEADLAEQVLRVPAGEQAEVSVKVNLTAEDKAYFAKYYPNGGYVDGFTTLTALHQGGVDLSLPYLGFYGDWAESPVLDDGSYWDYLNSPENAVVGNQYPHILFSEFQGDANGIYPGMNAYVDEPFDMAHISLSPDGDGYLDTVSDLYISLMRNAKTFKLTYTDMVTGEEYFGVVIDNVNKSVYYSSYGQVIPFAYNLFIAEPALYDWNGLENNTQVLLKVEVQGVDANDTVETWEVPITVDLEAPELLKAEIVEDEENGTTSLVLSFRDNLAASVAMVIDGSGTIPLAVETVEDVEPDENGYQNYTKTFDITGLTGKVMIILADYAINESYYGINLGGEGTPYGDLVAYQYNFNTGANGWVSFDADVEENETTMFSNFEMDFVAAEYVNGFVYAQTENGALYGFKYTDMLNNTMTLEDVYITQLDNVYQDFAYSYYDGKLYGLLTMEEMWMGEPSVTTEVYSINLRGEYYDEEMWMEMSPYQEDWAASRGNLFGLGMAIDDEGSVYIMGQYHENIYDEETWEYVGTEVSDAQLWKASMEESWGMVSLGAFRLVGDTGMSMDYLQSMAWDHNTEKLYWARFDGGASFVECELIEVDPTVVTEDENGNVMVSAVKVGALSGETCALFAPLKGDAAATHTNVPEMDANVVGTPILRESTVTMSLGGVHQLTYDLDPWYTSHRDVIWSSADESIATVDANGCVTAVGAGSVVITVTAADDESKSDSCTVEISALSLKLEGIVSGQGAGIGNVSGVGIYEFAMDQGVASMNGKADITASSDMNYGLSLATSELGRGSIWACEYGNTGMIYEIDAVTGAVKNVLEPIDGDMMFGMHYSEKLDSFTAIMNFYLYADVPMTEEMYEEMMGSYDEQNNYFAWHRVNLLPYLQGAGANFITGETGQGASSEVVFCAVTGVDGGIRDAWGETYYNDSYRDYLGNWDMSGSMLNYQPDQTLILLDNVGRLWYINEVTGLSREADDWGNVLLTRADGIEIMNCGRPGVMEVQTGADTYSMFHITQIVETPLTDMFRDGTMPRITYHFSDIEFAGYTAEGDPMIAMSLYDYWNNGTTNELYLYIPGHETDEMDYETWEPIRTPDRLFALGTTGEKNIIATIHYAEVTGGVDPEPAEVSTVVNKLAAGVFKAN